MKGANHSLMDLGAHFQLQSIFPSRCPISLTGLDSWHHRFCCHHPWDPGFRLPFGTVPPPLPYP